MPPPEASAEALRDDFPKELRHEPRSPRREDRDAFLEARDAFREAAREYQESHTRVNERARGGREPARSRSRGNKERELQARRGDRDRDRRPSKAEQERHLDRTSRAKRHLSQAVKDGSRTAALEACLTLIELEERPPQELLRAMLERCASRPDPDLFAKTLQCCILAKLRLEPQHFVRLMGMLMSREAAHAQVRAVLNLALPRGAEPIPLVPDDLSWEERRQAFQDTEVLHEDGEGEDEFREDEDYFQPPAEASASAHKDLSAGLEGGADPLAAVLPACTAKADLLRLEMRGCEAMPGLNGLYTRQEALPEVLGHDRPVYKRTADETLDRDVFIYYIEGNTELVWMSGWWISFDEVASDGAVAYNPASTWGPPSSKWQVHAEGQRRPDPALLLPPEAEAKQLAARTPEEAEQALSQVGLAGLAGCLAARTPELAAYFGHFVTLLHLEHLTEIGQHRRRMLRHPPERLMKMGYALGDLQCTTTYGRRETKNATLPGWPDRGTEFVGFALPWGTDLERLRIKRGDSVILSRTDPFKDRVGEGSVAELGPKKLVVHLAAAMPDDAKSTRWRLDTYVNRTVYERQITALLELVRGEKTDPLLEMLVCGEVGGLDSWASRVGAPPWRKQADRPPQPAEKSSSRCAKLAAEEVRGVDKKKLEEARAETDGVQNLNDSQKGAVKAALARRCTIVQGPPGTGKTHVSVKILCLWAKKMGLTPLLATSDSNVAVDNIAEGLHLAGVKTARVGRPEKVRGHLEEITLESMVEKVKEGARLKEMQEWRARAEAAVEAAEVEAEVLDEADSHQEDPTTTAGGAAVGSGKEKQDTKGAKLLGAMMKIRKGDAEEMARDHSNKRLQRKEDFETRMKILGDMEVICATTIAAGGDFLSRFTFKAILIDEVAQSTEASSIVPIALRGAKQIVLVGDHCQLPPSVLSREAEMRGYSVSVYNRLMDAGVEPHFLDTQYRSHPRIVEFSAKCFYNGGLRSGVRGSARPPPQGVPWPNPQVPVAFFEVGEDEAQDGESKANHAEVEVVRNLVLALLAQGELGLGDIGVVTPYMAQVRALRRSLREALPQDAFARMLEIASVDSFQGREKELIIFSAVRCNDRGNVGFLADWRRLNVMLTRARRGLVVLGAAKTLRHDPHWQQWLEWCHGLKAIGKLDVSTSSQAAGGRAWGGKSGGSSWWQQGGAARSRGGGAACGRPDAWAPPPWTQGGAALAPAAAAGSPEVPTGWRPRLGSAKTAASWSGASKALGASGGAASGKAAATEGAPAPWRAGPSMSASAAPWAPPAKRPRVALGE